MRQIISKLRPFDRKWSRIVPFSYGQSGSDARGMRYWGLNTQFDCYVLFKALFKPNKEVVIKRISCNNHQEYYMIHCWVLQLCNDATTATNWAFRGAEKPSWLLFPNNKNQKSNYKFTTTLHKQKKYTILKNKKHFQCYYCSVSFWAVKMQDIKFLL